MSFFGSWTLPGRRGLKLSGRGDRLSGSARATGVLVTALCAVAAGLLAMSAPAFAIKEYVPGVPSSFGSTGTGAGQFKEPVGVAVNDSTGDVYVVDSGNRRVERFSSTGVFLSEFNGTGAPTGAFSAPGGIAVDNSSNPLDPSAGDVYVADTGHKVVDQFSASGTYLSQLTGRCTEPGTCPGKVIPFVEPEGVAVDPSGNLWVAANRVVGEFSDTGSFVRQLSTGLETGSGLAVDSKDNVYVTGFGAKKFESATGAELAQFGGYYGGVGGVAALAINPSTDNLLLDATSSIELYGPFAEPYRSTIQIFPTEPPLSGSLGLAVNGAGTAYVSEVSANKVEIFNYLLFATVSPQPGSTVSETRELLHASVNPEGLPVTSCQFEYVTDAAFKATAYTNLSSGGTVPCVAPSAGEIPSDSKAHAIHAEVTGLQPRTTYHFRLAAANANGTEHGKDEAFSMGSPPLLTGESSSNVGSAGATVGAQLNAGGLRSTYHVDYGTTPAYGSSTPEASFDAPQSGAVGVLAQLSGLQPGTLYHFRFVATNALGTALGEDMTLTTAQSLGNAALTLPDERVYEMVSPLDNANVYVPAEGYRGRNGTDTWRPFRASADGNAVAFVGEAPSTGGGGIVGSGLGDQWLATRDPAGGWTAGDIQPPSGRSGSEYHYFSRDLSVGIVAVPGDGQVEPRLTADAPANCPGLYSRTSSDGGFHTLFTTTQTPGNCGVLDFAGASADSSHLVFQTKARLTPNAVEAAGDTNYEPHDNLYESVAGQLRLVNVLPEGKPDPNATFGSPWAAVHEPNFSNVISADGAHIFWTDMNTSKIYVRENGTSTVPVSAGAAFYWTASSDGRYVFYTEGEKLLRFAIEGETREELAGAGANVQGVIGVSQDGAYVYFVAGGILASNENSEKGKAEEGAEKDNLYLRHNGVTTYIMTLSPNEGTNNFAGPGGNESYIYGDWLPANQSRTAEVTPDGHSLVLYGGRGLSVYNADAGKIYCASCYPNRASSGDAYLPTSPLNLTSTPRWISDDGSRLFFDSLTSFDPHATNGLQNVYEWEREGAGSCRQSGGCVYLLSGGGSTDHSFFLAASASGNDVFFATRGQLVPQDTNGNVKVYDARVNGLRPPSPPACTGTGCQGVPPAPPIFATPSSVTFSGIGNFPAPSVAVKAKSKPTKCKRGFVKRHGKCVRKKAGKAKHAKRSNGRSKRGRK